MWAQVSLISDLITTGDVGNRNVMVSVTDGTAVHWRGQVSGACAASQAAGYDVQFAQQGTVSTSGRRRIDNTASTNVAVRENCPIAILPAGWKIIIEDVNDIAVADQLTLRLQYTEYDA